MKIYGFLSIVLLGAVIFSGCGKSGQSDDAVNAQGTCGSGQISTQYGCLSQGGCPSGYGLYSNPQYGSSQCVPASSTAQNPYGNGNNPFGTNPYGAPNGGYGVPYPNYGGPYYPGYYPYGGNYPYQNTGSFCQSGNCAYFYYSPWQQWQQF
jgi:hypothetical protein